MGTQARLDSRWHETEQPAEPREAPSVWLVSLLTLVLLWLALSTAGADDTSLRAPGEIGDNDFRVSDMGPNLSDAYEATVPDVAYNSTNNRYLVVWMGDDNTPPQVDSEYEIWGQRINAATGAAVWTNDFRISDMGPDGAVVFGASDPAVAYNAGFNEYLVVWRGDDDLVGVNENEIFGQHLDAATGAESGGNDVRLSDMGPDGSTGFNVEYAAVAANGTDNQYLVVWSGDTLEPLVLADEEYEIFGQRMVAGVLFSDHFETGDLSAWTSAAP